MIPTLRRRFAFLIPLPVLLAVIGCTERLENEPDRRPGPAHDMPTNALEGSSTGRGVSPATGPAMTIQRPPVTNLNEIISNPNSSALVSQQVQLIGVPVQRVLSGQYVIVGEGDRGVVVRLAELLPGVKAGQRLNVSGMIAQLGEDLAHWELDPENKELVKGHSIFINAIQSSISSEP